MSKKMGRPKVDNPKDIDLKVRIDKATNEKLISYCETNSISRAEAVRQGITMLLEE